MYASTGIRYCTDCINDEQIMRPVALYSLTLCGTHFMARQDATLAAATPEEWAAAWARA